MMDLVGKYWSFFCSTAFSNSVKQEHTMGRNQTLMTNSKVHSEKKIDSENKIEGGDSMMELLGEC